MEEVMGASRIEPTGSNTGTGEMVSPPEDKYVAASTSATVYEGEAAVSPIEALTLRGTLDRSADLRNPSGCGDESETNSVDVVRKQISLDTWGVTSNPFRLIPGTAKLIRGVPQSLPVEERVKLRLRQDPTFRRGKPFTMWGQTKQKRSRCNKCLQSGHSYLKCPLWDIKK